MLRMLIEPGLVSWTARPRRDIGWLTAKPRRHIIRHCMTEVRAGPRNRPKCVGFGANGPNRPSVREAPQRPASQRME